MPAKRAERSTRTAAKLPVLLQRGRGGSSCARRPPPVSSRPGSAAPPGRRPAALPVSASVGVASERRAPELPVLARCADGAGSAVGPSVTKAPPQVCPPRLPAARPLRPSWAGCRRFRPLGRRSSPPPMQPAADVVADHGQAPPCDLRRQQRDGRRRGAHLSRSAAGSAIHTAAPPPPHNAHTAGHAHNVRRGLSDGPRRRRTRLSGSAGPIRCGGWWSARAAPASTNAAIRSQP